MRNLKFALTALATVLVFVLIKEHWVHVAGYWFYLILLLCPFLHFFHGHGNHNSKESNNRHDAHK